MAALEQCSGVVLGQVEVGAKTNKIPLITNLLDALHFTDVVVTADALHCQRGTTDYIVGRGGHYVFTVKNNQPSLRIFLKSLLWNDIPVSWSTGGRGHEQERGIAFAYPGCPAPALRSANGVITQECDRGNKISVGWRPDLASSDRPSPEFGSRIIQRSPMTSFVPQQVSGFPVLQAAWVVRDLEKTMSHWLELGVGPFYTFDVDLPSVKYRGEESSLSMRIGLVQAGALQLEFIQQTSDKPSAYTDGELSGAASFHHICRDYGDYDEAVAKLEAQGAVLATEAQWGECRFCYVDVRDTLGCFIELCDDTETGRKMYEIVREGAENWDGKDPIRDLASLLA